VAAIVLALRMLQVCCGGSNCACIEDVTRLDLRPAHTPY
jgi:hypothetical protein